jgi:hypothetical protein
VNKCIWSALGWDERADVRQVLREYARYFIGPQFEETFADGLLALEQNWVGPLRANRGIEKTLEAFQAMERAASPAVKRNWRFQQALYRAYFDAHVAARLRREMAAADNALNALRTAKSSGPAAALAAAETALARTVTDPTADALRSRTSELAEALFQSIHAQLSVRKYQAIAVERGATLDTLGVPLADAGWLREQIAAVKSLPDAPTRLARIDALLTRTDPGPGGFYDALGDPARRPHLVVGEGWKRDPAFYATPLTGFSFRGYGPDQSHPRSWWTHAEALYDSPLQVRYSVLDRDAKYRVRVVYGLFERRTAKVRLTANDGVVIHDFLARPFEPLEFDVPPEATAGGTLTLNWTQPPGASGTGRGGPVCEVWLMRR